MGRKNNTQLRQVDRQAYMHTERPTGLTKLRLAKNDEDRSRFNAEAVC